jgi:hypothetical protein
MSGESAKVRITNSSDQEVQGEYVKLQIDTPRGVEVENVRHATETDSGYRLIDNLEPGESIRIPLVLNPIPGIKYEDYRGEVVNVEVFINGEKESTEQFKL